MIREESRVFSLIRSNVENRGGYGEMFGNELQGSTFAAGIEDRSGTESQTVRTLPSQLVAEHQLTEQIARLASGHRKPGEPPQDPLARRYLQHPSNRLF